ncbi:MAG: cysteine desulfurase [Candidatus Heimdallarchaeota archaeon]|nr:cysteine desulfurase [Candidatus Heimdallarchaeota archaeon]
MGIQSTQFQPITDIDGIDKIPKLSTDANQEEINSYTKNLSSGLHLSGIPVLFGSEEREEPELDQSVKSVYFDAHIYRKDFPVLHRTVNGKQLIWMDNGATTQKPQQVIDAVKQYYAEYNSNIHRGAHTLAAEATDAYEEAREKVQRFIGAEDKKEIIFVRGTTEAINLVAQTYGRQNIEKGDEIIVSELEHHSNIVPWQLLAKEKGAFLRIARTDKNGDLDMGDFEQLFNSRTRLVCVTHASNAIGTVPPIKEIVDIAHKHDVPVLVDGAQSIPHLRVNVAQLDVDFYVFSGHKMFAPMGVGVLYGKAEILRSMPPWQGGGSMIKDVEFDKTEFNDIPEKFEAGTPNVVGPIGLGVAIDYLSNIGMEQIAKYEHSLLMYATKKLQAVPGLHLIGSPKHKIGVLSFVIDDVSPDEIGKKLDSEGIAVRVGHHCAQPILRKFGYEAVVRPSLAFYNTYEEIDRLVEVLCDYMKQKQPYALNQS